MLIIVAWLSLVERCVRDAEVASSNLVATTKNTPSHMCEGVFLFLQLFKLTTSNWFGHTVRAQRVHEVRGTSAWTDRSGAETASSNLVYLNVLNLRPLTGSDTPFGRRDPTRSGGPRPRPTKAEWRPQIQLSLVQLRAECRKFSPIPIITNTVEIFITC